MTAAAMALSKDATTLISTQSESDASQILAGGGLPNRIPNNIPIIPARATSLGPTPEQWESRREQIRRLYMDEDKPLKDIVATLRKQGFKASSRMYKYRLLGWGYTKRSSRRETRDQNDREYSKSAGRSDIRASEKRSPQSSSTTSEDSHEQMVRVETRPIPVPDTVRLSEMFLRWFNVSTAEHLSGEVNNGHAEKEYSVFRILYDYRRGLHLLSRKQWHGGGTSLQRAFASIHELFEFSSPIPLFNLILFNLFWPDMGVYSMLWRYLTAYATLKLPEGHFLRHLFEIAAICEKERGISAHFQTIFDAFCAIVSMHSKSEVLSGTRYVEWTLVPDRAREILTLPAGDAEREPHRQSSDSRATRQEEYMESIMELSLSLAHQYPEDIHILERLHWQYLLAICFHHQYRICPNSPMDSSGNKSTAGFLSVAGEHQPHQDTAGQLQLLNAWNDALVEASEAHRNNHGRFNWEKTLVIALAPKDQG